MGDDSPAPAAALALLFRAYGLDDADFSRGAPLAEKALAMAPESTVLNLLAATRQKNDNRRRQYLRLAAEGTPASEFARCQLMQMDLSGGFERRAAETAQAMLKENRNLPPALHVLAQVARKRDWEAEEHACALRLTQIVPYFVPGWERLAATAANAPAAIAALSGARPYNFNLRLELAGKLRAMGKVDAVLTKHFEGFTIQDAQGGWTNDDGSVSHEYTLVIYLSDTTIEKVRAAADDLIREFNQSSVLIQANETTTEFYAGA